MIVFCLICGNHSYSFFAYKGGFLLMKSNSKTNEPEKDLFQIKRRKRKSIIDNKVQNITYQSLFDTYVRECRIKNLSETTIQGYKNATRYFLDFTGIELYCDDITQDLINEYYLHLQEHYKPETVNSYVFKISPTVKYGIEKRYIKEEIEFTHCKEQEKIKDIYTDDELKILLQRPGKADFVDIRAWVIINVLISTGIRAKELRDLKISDVNLSGGYITMNSTKNRQARVIPISSTLFTVLAEWLKIRNAPIEDYVFCNIFGEPLQRTALQCIVKRYSKKRGVNKYGLHLYRHTFITLSVRKGMSPVLLKRITGHANYKILEKYYSFNPTDLVNIVDEFNPLEDFKPKKKRY